MWTWRIPLALVLAAMLSFGFIAGRIPAWLALAYGLMGLVSLLAYRADKRAAERGAWRISEATLHGLDLAFGIGGGLIGQSLLRHKTRKAGYVAATVLILLVHLGFLATLLVGAFPIIGG